MRSVHWAVNDTPAERTNLPSTLLWGDEAIEEEILGLRFRVRPTAFLQTNTEMAETLYALARDDAALTGRERVFDLYSGTGTIALALAGGSKSVWGVEISDEAVACAVENAELNGIENVRFRAGNVGQTLEGLVADVGAPDVLVVDPPRAGLAGKALRRAGALGADGSSTSPATRRRSRPTWRCSGMTSATSSCASDPSTCFRTRRTSSRCRCSRSRLAS